MFGLPGYKGSIKLSIRVQGSRAYVGSRYTFSLHTQGSGPLKGSCRAVRAEELESRVAPKLQTLRFGSRFESSRSTAPARQKGGGGC